MPTESRVLARSVPARPDGGPRRQVPRGVVPLVVGLLGSTVSVVGSWVPSVWYDEAATVTSATRSWVALGREVPHVDVVHALYFAVMHVWFAVVGYSPFTLRLPSAIAVGTTAALVVLLGTPLAGQRVGLVAGLLFPLLPRVTWMVLYRR
ncbi:hypothetical protein [Curtobacterium luteum]|uniref:hypothetical protein n=1 Tax=Curtobacterium luteum TaxID=33881 RepID=UPI0016631D17|nr:hypothetical protein [Curtobacterium luteum]